MLKAGENSKEIRRPPLQSSDQNEPVGIRNVALSCHRYGISIPTPAPAPSVDSDYDSSSFWLILPSSSQPHLINNILYWPYYMAM